MLEERGLKWYFPAWLVDIEFKVGGMSPTGGIGRVVSKGVGSGVAAGGGGEGRVNISVGKVGGEIGFGSIGFVGSGYPGIRLSKGGISTAMLVGTASLITLLVRG